MVEGYVFKPLNNVGRQFLVLALSSAMVNSLARNLKKPFRHLLMNGLDPANYFLLLSLLG